MEVLQNSYADLSDGTVVELMGKDLAMIRFVRERKSDKERKDGEAARTYYHFSIGGRGFTIDETDMDSVNLLRDKVQKKTVASLMLEATTHQVPKLDDDLQPIDGEFELRKSFRFVSIVTAEDAIAYAKNAGQVKQEEAKWAPKENIVSDAKLAHLIGNALNLVLPGAIAAAMPQPVAQPALAGN